VLEGSVRKSGNQIRVTAQLIDVKDDLHVWSQTWDKELNDVFEIQDEIAQAVVQALKVKLFGDMPRAASTPAASYSLFLKARSLHSDRSMSSLAEAEALLTQALDIDSDYAPSWVLLGDVRVLQGLFFEGSSADDFSRARTAARKALEIDSQLASAFALMASIAMSYDWDFEAARRYIDQALAINPADPDVLAGAMKLAWFTNRPDDALEYAAQALTLDPLSADALYEWAQSLFFGGRAGEAAPVMRKVAALSPDYIAAHYFIGNIHALAGEWDEAIAAYEKEPVDGFRLTGLAGVYHAMGRDEESDFALAELERDWFDDLAVQIALVYAGKGDLDRAFEWLEHAYDKRDSGIPFMFIATYAQAFQGDPRLEELGRRLGLEVPEYEGAYPPADK
jgi:tetratricopeptide (TPR) repeat protein